MRKILFFAFIIGLISCGGKTGTAMDTQTTVIREDLDKNGLEIDLKVLSFIEQETDKKCEPLKREVWKYRKDGSEEHYFLDTGVVFKFVNENSAQTCPANLPGHSSPSSQPRSQPGVTAPSACLSA